MVPLVATQEPDLADSEEETPKAPQVPLKINFEKTGTLDKASDSSQFASEINFETTGDSETNPQATDPTPSVVCFNNLYYSFLK